MNNLSRGTTAVQKEKVSHLEEKNNSLFVKDSCGIFCLYVCPVVHFLVGKISENLFLFNNLSIEFPLYTVARPC